MHIKTELPVQVPGTAYLRNNLWTSFLDPTMSVIKPNRANIIATKHNTIVTRITLTITEVTHINSEIK